jgi:hypothetical protein
MGAPPGGVAFATLNPPSWLDAHKTGTPVNRMNRPDLGHFHVPGQALPCGGIQRYSITQLERTSSVVTAPVDRLAAAGRIEPPPTHRTCENPVITLGLFQPLSRSVGSSTPRSGQVSSGAGGRRGRRWESTCTRRGPIRRRGRLLRWVPVLSALATESPAAAITRGRGTSIMVPAGVTC